MSDSENKVNNNENQLLDAQAKGLGATPGAYLKLSGFGWLQSAITLESRRLSTALIIGIKDGADFLRTRLPGNFSANLFLPTK